MNKKYVSILKKGMCVAMSIALLGSTFLLKDETKTYAAKEQFVKTTDENYSNPNDKNFLLYVEDIFNIKDKGVVFTGRVTQGKVKVGDSIQITNYENGKPVLYTMKVQSIEMVNKTLEQAETGDNIGIYVGWPFGEDGYRGPLKRGAVIQGTSAPIVASKTIVGVFTPAKSGFTGSFGNGFQVQAKVGYCDFTCKFLDVNGSGIAAGQSPRYGVKIGDFENGGCIVYPGMEISIRKDGKTYGTFVVVSTEEYVKEAEETTKTVKKANTITVKAKKKTVKFKKLKKKKITVSKAIVVKKAIGKVTYKKVKKGSSSKLSINEKTGKITVKKKTKKGTYKIVVKVTAAGNSQYLAKTKKVTVKIKVK
jgi:selenocysteine-specific translation elongation factor